MIHMSEYDLIIKNTQIVDGSGKAPYKGSIGVKRTMEIFTNLPVSAVTSFPCVVAARGGPIWNTAITKNPQSIFAGSHTFGRRHLDKTRRKQEWKDEQVIGRQDKKKDL